MTYRKEDFSSLYQMYHKGEKLINCSATGVILNVVVKILQDVNAQLTFILSKERLVKFDYVRKLILLIQSLQTIEFLMYGAFATGKDDLFYQSKDSEDWNMINANLVTSEISDPENYFKQLRVTLDNAAILQGSIL